MGYGKDDGNVTSTEIDQALSIPKTDRSVGVAAGKRAGEDLPTRSGFWLPTALRFGSHGLVWTLVLVPALVQMANGWRATGDEAEISIGSYQVFTSRPPLLGAYSEVTAGIHAIFDLGPLLFWMLAVPVRLDPNQGVLWGAALLCGVALSLAIEAVWSLKGWPACVALALVTADVSWQTHLMVDLEWNPHIGLVFLIAAGAIAWVVTTGRFGWWPLVVLFGSIAAQCHFIYVAPACALAVISPLSALAFGQRPSRWRWLVVGAAIGAACWLATLVQEAFGHPGNLTLILNSGAQAPRVGLGFGFHALAMAAAPHPIWLTPYPFGIVYFGMPAYLLDRPIIWGIIAPVAVVTIAVIAGRAQRFELSALSIVGTVMAIGTVISFASFPADNLAESGYLLNMLWVVGTLIWIIAVWGCLALGREIVLRWIRGRPLTGGRLPLLHGLEVAGLTLLVIAGIAGVRSLTGAAHGTVESVKAVLPLDRSIARSVEHNVPPGPVIVVVQSSTFPHLGDPSIDYKGLAWILLTDGWHPGLEFSYFGPALHLSVPPGARWPEVIVRVNPSSNVVTGVERVNPTDSEG
jgi:hypothetical protein